MPDTGGGDIQRVLRVLMRFGLDEQSAQQVKEALTDQESDLKDLQAQWEMLRKQAGLTEAETVTAIQGSVTGMKLKQDQILAIGHAYEEEQKAAESAAGAEADSLARIDANTKQIAASFTNAIGAGRALSELGRAGTIFGTLFKDQDLKTMGEFVTGTGQIVMLLGRMPQLIKEIQSVGGVLGGLGAAGTVAAGVATAGIVAGIIGIIQQIENTSNLLKAMQGVQALPEAQRQQFAQQYQGDITANIPLDEKVQKINADLAEFTKQQDAAAKETKKTSDTLDHYKITLSEARAGIETLGNVLQGLGAGGIASQLQHLFTISPEAQAAAKQYQDYQQKLTDIDQKGAAERVKINAENQKQINTLTANFTKENARAYQAFVDANVKAADEFQRQQMKIAQQGMKEEQKAEASYYQQRAKAAAAFGVEMFRLEQDHQIAMQRLQQDHTVRLRRLAETRDALAIEDENSSYERNRSRAEQDYQKEVSRKNQDYARQLAEQETAFKEQRAQRQADRLQQLADLQQSYQDQQAERQKQYSQAAAERQKNLSDELAKAQQDGRDKLTELDRQMQNEKTQATDQWTQWRQEHGVFLAGEKALWDDYLQYTYNALEKYMTGGTAPGVLGYGGGPASHQAGGYQEQTGLARMHAGEFVLNAQTTKQAERAAGGSLTQENVLAMVARGGTHAGKGAGAALNVTIHQTFSGQQSQPDEYRRIVYETVTDLFRRARQ